MSSSENPSSQTHLQVWLILVPPAQSPHMKTRHEWASPAHPIPVISFSLHPNRRSLVSSCQCLHNLTHFPSMCADLQGKGRIPVAGRQAGRAGLHIDWSPSPWISDCTCGCCCEIYDTEVVQTDRQVWLMRGASYTLKLEEAQSARAAAGSATHRCLLHLWKWAGAK